MTFTIRHMFYAQMSGYFLKPFLKGTIFQSGEWERRGKFDFDHYFAFLTNYTWKDRTFCLVASFSARREDHFQKKNLPKTDHEVQRVLYKLVLVTYPRSRSISEDLQPFKHHFYSKNKKINCVPITIIILHKINLEHLEFLRPWGPPSSLKAPCLTWTHSAFKPPGAKNWLDIKFHAQPQTGAYSCLSLLKSAASRSAKSRQKYGKITTKFWKIMYGEFFEKHCYFKTTFRLLCLTSGSW